VLSPYAQDAVISFRSCEVLMNLSRESFYTLFFQISGFICATIAGMIIARALGPENKGILAVAMLCPYIFFVTFNPTIEAAVIYRIGKKEQSIKAFTGSILMLSFAFSIIALVGFFITFVQFRESLYKGIEQKYLMIAISSIPFYFILYYFSSILRGRMDIKGYNISNQLLNFTNILFILIFITVSSLNLLAAIIAHISGIIFGGIYAVIKALKMAKGVYFDKRLGLQLVKDGGKLYVGSIATFISFPINLFILNYYANSSEVGFYSVAYAIGNTLLFLTISLEIVLYPKIAQATMDEAIKLTEIASRQILILTAVGALGVALFSRYIVLIYGGKSFLPSVKPLLLLLPGVVLLVIPKALNSIWLRKGWFFQMTLIAVSTAIISLALNFLLIPKFGANGAAMALSLTYGFIFVVEIVLYTRYVKNDLRRLFIPEKTDTAIYRDIIRIFNK
jgi:O-antigen/teichoic acid export membrane protein